MTELFSTRGVAFYRRRCLRDEANVFAVTDASSLKSRDFSSSFAARNGAMEKTRAGRRRRRRRKRLHFLCLSVLYIYRVKEPNEEEEEEEEEGGRGVKLYLSLLSRRYVLLLLL